jgi:hypothetical protein
VKQLHAEIEIDAAPERVWGGTRLMQSEAFTSLLVPVFARSLDAHAAAGFGLMNAALKARAEQRSADGPR